MGDVCTDGRFALIERFKRDLVEATNIETSPEEMAVLDSILFRMWQMGWLDRLEQPAASPWRRVEEPPKEGTWCVIAKHSYLQPHNLFYDIAHYLHGTFSVYVSEVGDWFDGKPLYWMPFEPPKEENK